MRHPDASLAPVRISVAAERDDRLQMLLMLAGEVGVATPLQAEGGAEVLIVAADSPGGLERWVARERKRGSHALLLAVGSDESAAAVERVLDAGADDYVAYPSRGAELPGRLRTLVRRCRAPQPAIPRLECTTVPTCCGASRVQDDLLELSENGRCATWRGHTAALTSAEFRLLLYLVQRAGNWVTARELMTGALGYPASRDTGVVRVHVSSLKKKLGPAAP